MATYSPPKRATEYIFYVGLADSANAGLFKASPTLASGDVTVSKDGAAAANITTLPTVTPSGGKRVKVTLSSGEMDADNVTVVFSDASGAEWDDLIINIAPSANQLDDIASAVTTVDTVVDGIKAVTDNLPDSGALTTIDGNIDAILLDTGTDGVVVASGSKSGYSLSADQSGVTVGTVNALGTQAKADVNAEADTAISDASLATASSITTLGTKVLKYFQLLFRKDAAIATDNATELTAINADGGSGSGAYANTTDSVEAIRDRGDAAWAGGGSAPSAADIRAEIDANSTQLAAIVADTSELQTDWANGGRLDLILDATATQTSVDALNDLSTADIDARLAAYDAATGTEAAAITSAISALNNLSAAQVNAEVDTALSDVGLTTTITGRIDAAISTRSSHSAANVVTALMAHALESGKTVDQAWLDIWSVIVGDSAADDGTNPTSITYDSPDGTVQRTHALTSTARTVS